MYQGYLFRDDQHIVLELFHILYQATELGLVNVSANLNVDTCWVKKTRNMFISSFTDQVAAKDKWLDK